LHYHLHHHLYSYCCNPLTQVVDSYKYISSHRLFIHFTIMMMLQPSMCE
jgi:hypothetical protein